MENNKNDWHKVGKEQKLFWCDLPNNSSFEFIVSLRSKKNRVYKVKDYKVAEYECICLNDSKPYIVAWSPFILSFPYISFLNALLRTPIRCRVWLEGEVYHYMRWTKINRKILKIHEIRKLTEEELEKTKSALESQNLN